ncbi:cytochrome P450 [Streptomyces sp. NBC_00047]|uniref:cytochrome P450 n=1 Tax=Streptomyces sp. NBC_00047 TaxID=2975627 RepID=UPI002250E489|nr:cytochrome P450 [Streptomyces sp. NBC_00047]MCX5609487.1 cytochrome P450 [Streptomyces sp. NBC_00047]
MTATTLPRGTGSGPRQWPLIGNLPAFARDPLAFFESLRDDHGDWVPWALGPQRNVLISRPEHAGELLGAVEGTFKPMELGWAFHQLLGDGVVVATGDDWRRKRALVQPAVRPRQVRSYAATMVECADALAGSWREGDRIDVHREMAGLTQRIAVRTLFGSDAAGREAPISAAMATAQRELGAEFRGLTLFLPPWVRTPGRRRMREAVAVLDREIAHVIREHEAASAAGAERDDLLSRLLAARDEHGAPLSRKELRDESITLYIGGHETTSTTLTWAWQLLSGAPGARARLTGELDRVLGGRLPTYDDYARLPWTRQVVKESLRIYPQIWLISAVAGEGASIGGRPVPAGTALWTSPWSMHRDERWFPDPEAFRPERWDADAPHPVPDHAWIPFGGGPRACLGARFALVEAVLVLAVLGQRFHLDSGSERAGVFPGLTLQPTGPVRATLRPVPGGEDPAVPRS